jgi:FtsH-binding integral membrane protein
MDQNRASRPDKVGQAVILSYVTLGIGVLRSIMEASRLSQQEQVSTGFVMFIIFGVLAIIWFFIYMIGKGKNWARITLLVLFILGIPFSVLPLLQSLAANPISGLLGITQIVIQIVVLVFLFQKQSSDWFRQAKANR